LEALAADLEAQLSTALALNGMGGFLFDLASDLVFLDSGALAVFGLRPDEFDGRTSALHARIASEDLAGLLQRRSDAAEGSAGFGAYFRICGSDDAVRWAHVQAAIQRDDAGRPRRIVGVVREAGRELKHIAQQDILELNRQRQTDVVQVITAALSRALTLEDVLAALAGEEFLAPLDASGASLTVLEQDRLRRLGASTPEIFRDHPYSRIYDPLPGPEAFRTQKPLFLTTEEAQERFPILGPYLQKARLTAAALLPLAAQAKPTGVLAIYYEGKRDFSPEERNLLLALAATVAQSVQRAALYDEEHAMAVGLQQSMLPASIPAVAGLRVAVRYQPARTGRQIGGDWYDVIPLPDGRAGLVVGDVQGHDIHAAAVMGQLRTALRAYAAEGHTPAALMDKASAFLNDLDTERLATCIYVDLDPATGHAQFVRAGHQGPLIRRGDGRTIRVAVEGGLPLGLSEYSDAPYPATHLRLGPGDTLLLCTDGLLESHGTDLDEGTRQIQELVCNGPADLEQLIELIIATVESREEQEDDVALLLATLRR
jgi:serine phosphatase RsbU (regulator of sigma subunit)